MWCWVLSGWGAAGALPSLARRLFLGWQSGGVIRARGGCLGLGARGVCRGWACLGRLRLLVSDVVRRLGKGRKYLAPTARGLLSRSCPRAAVGALPDRPRGGGGPCLSDHPCLPRAGRGLDRGRESGSGGDRLCPWSASGTAGGPAPDLSPCRDRGRRCVVCRCRRGPGPGARRDRAVYRCCRGTIYRLRVGIVRLVGRPWLGSYSSIVVGVCARGGPAPMTSECKEI